jgi:hypothetical protein
MVKNSFHKQAMEVLDGVEMYFIAVLFLSKTPANIIEINKKADEYKIKVVCMDNFPSDLGGVLTDRQIKPNKDVYFTKFVSSVAHYLDPSFAYNPDEEEFDEDDDE